MARKRDDVFIIGSESPSPETAGQPVEASQAEPRNAFAPAPPSREAAGRRGRRLGLSRRLLLGGLAIGLIALALTSLRGGGGTGTPDSTRPPASEPLVAAPGPGTAPQHAAVPPRRRARLKRREPGRAPRRSPRPRRRSRPRRRTAPAEGPQAGEAPLPANALPATPEASPPPAPPAPSTAPPPGVASAPSPATAVSPSRPEFSFER